MHKNSSRISTAAQVHTLGNDKAVAEFTKKGVTTRDAWLYPYATDDVEAMCKASGAGWSVSPRSSPGNGRIPSKIPRKATLFASGCFSWTRNCRWAGAPS